MKRTWTAAGLGSVAVALAVIGAREVRGQKGTAREHALPAGQRGPVVGQNWRSPATGMEFVWIAPMNMWVGRYEATNGEYRRMHPNHDSGEVFGHSLNGNRQPVVAVNFDDAKAYAEWLTQQDRAVLGEARYRLPSEQEWETYARCGDNRTYPWGDEWPPRRGRAGNYWGEECPSEKPLQHWRIAGYNDGHRVTCNVEPSWANPWGLFGVGGNVWEVCARDRAGQSFGAWRGASWIDFMEGGLRVSARDEDDDPSARDEYSGFRLVLSR
jgi:formylglycine-generating enzyme